MVAVLGWEMLRGTNCAGARESDPPRFQISGGKAEKRVAKNGRSIMPRPGQVRRGRAEWRPLEGGGWVGG